MSKKSEPVREILGIPFYSLAEVARRARVGRQTVLAAITDGKLLAKKIGGVWWIHPLWFEAWTTTPTVGPRGATKEDDALRIAIMRIKHNRASERREALAAEHAEEERK